MRFTDIPGYQEAKEKLFSMMREQRIGHALAIVGSEGSPNLNLAIALAQFMSCENPLETDSCGTCKSCKKFEKYIHPDLHFYFPVTSSKKVPKKPISEKYYEEWRTFLTENQFVSLNSWLPFMDGDNKEASIYVDESQQIIRDLSLKSYESLFRFAIIWLPERMNISSANKLLKIIEEPPEKVQFILVTENPDQLLATILSRLQILRIGRMKTAEMKTWLEKKYPDFDADRIESLISISEGNPLKAIRSTEIEDDQMAVTNDFISWARMCYEARKKLPELLDWSDQMGTRKKDEQKRILNYALNFFRSGMLKNSSAEDLIHVYKEERDHIAKFSALLNIENTTKLVEIFNEAFYHLERNGNARIIFMDLSVSFGKLINPKNVHL